QIFFRFASAVSDFGVCPATYKRSSINRPFAFPLAFTLTFLAVVPVLAFIPLPHSSVSYTSLSLPRAFPKTHHLQHVLRRVPLPLLLLLRHQNHPRFLLCELRPHRLDLRFQRFPLAIQNPPLLFLGLLSQHIIGPLARLLRPPSRTGQHRAAAHVHRQQPNPVL